MTIFIGVLDQDYSINPTNFNDEPKVTVSLFS